MTSSYSKRQSTDESDEQILSGVATPPSAPTQPTEVQPPSQPTAEPTGENFDLGAAIKEGAANLAGNLINPVGGAIDGITNLANFASEQTGVQVPEILGNKVTDLASDAGNLPEIAGSQIVDNAVGLGELGLNTIGGGLDAVGAIEMEEENIPWSDQYQMGDYDLGTSQAKTEVGEFAATMLKFAAVGTATGGAGLLAQFGADGLLDFAEAPGEGNLSNMYEDKFGPNLITNVIAQDVDDNHLTRRLRNVLEGAVPGIGVVSAKQSVKALKAMSKAIRGGKTAEQAADIAADVLKQDPDVDTVSTVAKAENSVNSGRPATLYHGTTLRNASKISNSGFIPSTNRGEVGNLLGDGVYFTPDPKMARDYGPQVLSGNIGDLKIKTITADEWEAIAVRRGGLDEYSFLQNPRAMIEEFGDEFDGVRLKEAGASPNMVTGDEIVIFDPKKADQLIAPKDPIDGAPVSTARPPTLDPQDRVSQVFKTDVNRSAASFWDNPRPGGGDSVVDELDIQSIKTEQGLKDYVAAQIPGVDVDEISRRLSKQTPEHIKATWTSLADFANSGEIDALNPLQFSTKIDLMTGTEAGGVIVLDTLVKSVSDRLSILANEASQLANLDAPFKTQAKQIIDRAEALVIAKKEASQFASKGLENFKQVPPNLKRAVERDRQKITELFIEMRKGLESSDPLEVQKFKKQFSKLAIGLGASKGDPRIQMDVLEGVARVGLSRMQSVFINSILSGPLTHARNIAGNTVALAERPLSRAVGGGGVKSFYAFNGIHKSVWESLQIAKQSLSEPFSITTSTNKVTDYVMQDRHVLENAVNSAQKNSQKQAASVALKVFDLTNNPWFNWAGKALQAGDDLTKSILARMELRYQAGMEADNLVKGSDIKNQSELRERLYQDLVNQKLSPKGAIIDADLVDVADAASFQRPLEGWVSEWGNAIQGAPGGRFVMPFYKTPVNITRYAAQISPLAPLSSEWRQTVQFGTPDEKAIMRGRMALGSAVTASAAGLASQGLMTGYGPPPGPDRDLWLKKHEPMSILVGDKWVSYQALPGLSLVMSATADMTQLVGRLSDSDADYVLGALPFFVANAITSQPMFQGVINMSDMFDPSGWSPEGVLKSSGEFVNTMGGGAQLRRTFENAMRQNMADYKDWANTIIGKASGGIFGETVERVDVLTGDGIPTKYNNPLNLINPFTVVGKDRSVLLDTFDKLQFPIKLAVPTKVSGVKLTPDEQNFLGKAIYDNGNFPNSMKATLGSRDFETAYNSWRAQQGTGTQIPKEQAEWYLMLARVQSKYQSRALNQLRNSNSPISQNYRDTFAERSAKASTGKAGNLSPEEMGALREINRLSRWGK